MATDKVLVPTKPRRARKAGSKAGEVALKAADAMTDKLAGENIGHKVSEIVEAVSSTVTQGLSGDGRPRDWRPARSVRHVRPSSTPSEWQASGTTRLRSEAGSG